MQVLKELEDLQVAPDLRKRLNKKNGAQTDSILFVILLKDLILQNELQEVAFLEYRLTFPKRQ
ncbi:hypothetical protein RO09_03470 [Streptococcus sobrinus]|nr:hypothetical protein RO09_03470 [Streptococcus sobrinus]